MLGGCINRAQLYTEGPQEPCWRRAILERGIRQTKGVSVGRLSTIDSLEQRREREQQEASRQQEQAAAGAAQPQAAAPQQGAEQPAAPARKSQAQLEAEFHGLGTQGKRDGGHTALIAAAVIIVAAAAVYIANYTLHLF